MSNYEKIDFFCLKFTLGKVPKVWYLIEIFYFQSYSLSRQSLREQAGRL